MDNPQFDIWSKTAAQFQETVSQSWTKALANFQNLDLGSAMSAMAQENFRQWTALQESFLQSLAATRTKKPDDPTS